MLTLSTAFTEAFNSASVEPVMLAEIFTDTTDVSGTAYCTGGRIIEFAGISNGFSSELTGAKTAEPSIAFVSPLSLQIDPFERTISRTNITITFHDDGAIRAMAAGNLLFNKSITLKLGAQTIANETDYAPVFRGLIKGVVAREGQIDLHCAEGLEFLDRPYRGSWSNRHPLEAIKKVLEDCGTPADLIDSASFAVTNAEVEDIAHYVSTMTQTWGDPVYMYGHLFKAGTPVLGQDTFTRIHGLARAMNGGLYVREDGKAAFKRFDKTAAVVVHWGADEIEAFSHVDTIVVNEIEAGITSTGEGGTGERKDAVTVMDAASQTLHSYPGTTNGIFKRAVNFEINDMYGNFTELSGGGAGERGATTIFCKYAWSLAGARIVGEWIHGETEWVDLQTAGTEIDNDHPLWLKIDDEIMKCAHMVFNNEHASWITEKNADGENNAVDINKRNAPAHITLSILEENRGQLGTTAVNHALIEEQKAMNVVDITMAVDFANAQIDRFSNGAPVIEVSTNLAQWAVQVGDLVSVDSDVYLAYNFLGLASNTKFEVIRKELRLDDNNASILWGLAYATHTGVTAPTKTYKFKDPKQAGHSTGTTGASSKAFVKFGLEVTAHSADRTVCIGEGLGHYDGTDGPYYYGECFLLPADRHAWIDFHVPTGMPIITVKAQGLGAALPELGPGSIRLAEVLIFTTNVSIHDTRDTTTVNLDDLPTTDLKPGGNQIYNSGFEIWSGGASAPPDQWEVAAGTVWTTDATQESTIKLDGDFSLEISGDNKQINSKLLVADTGRAHEFSAAAIASDTALTVQAGVEWLDENKDPISTDYAINQTGLTTWTEKAVSVTPPDGSKFARVVLARGSVLAAGAPVGEVLLHFDDDLDDDSGNGRTVTGEHVTYITGKFLNAASFNGEQTAGDNSHIEIPGIDDIGTGPYSIEFWLYLSGGGGGGGLGDACFHLDDNTTDAVGGTAATWQGTPYSGDQYGTSTAGSGFGEMGRISNNPANNLDDNALSIPNPGIGTGAFTLEFFMDFSTSAAPTTTYQYWLSCGTTTANEFELYYHPSSNADKLVFISRQTAIGSATIKFDVVIGDNVPAHYALVRGADSGGNSTWALYVNGTAATISSGSATIRTQDITDPLVIGRYVPTNPYGIKDGGVDEVRVSKSAVYTENFTAPAAPFAPPAAPQTSHALLDNGSGQADPSDGNLAIVLYDGQLGVKHRASGAEQPFWSDHGMEAEEWYHIAIARDDSGVTRLFRGQAGETSTLIGTHSGSGYTVGGSGYDWTIGRVRTDSAAVTYNLKGAMDELLITKTAKYTEAFSVPGAAFSGPATGDIGDACFHLDDNTTDAAGGTAATIGGASLPATQYVTPTDLGYTNASDVWVSTLVSGGFGKSIHIAGTSGTSTPMNFLEVPNPVFGTGAITIEFFVQFLTDDRNQTLFTWIDGTNGLMFFTNYHYPYGASDTRKLSLWNNDAGTAHYCNWDIEWDSDLTKSKHYALQRTADSGGYAQWDLFIDGDKITHAGAHGSPLGNLQTVNITGTEHFQFGSYTPDGTYQGNYYLDELRINKSLAYSGSTYTVPIAPFAEPGEASEVSGYFDRLRLTRSIATFRAKQETAQTGVAAAGSAVVAFDVEDHDIGSQYDNVTGYKFTAGFDGIYQFAAQVWATVPSEPSTQGPSISIVKNRGGTPSTIASGGYSYESNASLRRYVFTVESGSVQLSAGDTIDIEILNVTNEVMTIRDNGSETWFTGRQIS